MSARLRRWALADFRAAVLKCSVHAFASGNVRQDVLAGRPDRDDELVYRHELRPVITTGAEVMDRILTQLMHKVLPGQPSHRAAARCGTSGTREPRLANRRSACVLPRVRAGSATGALGQTRNGSRGPIEA